MNIRPQRIADSIKDLLAEVFYQKVRDPRLKNIWISSVQVSSDLQIAKVYYRIKETTTAESTSSALDDAETNPHTTQLRAAEALKACAGFLRSQVASGLVIKRTPTLRFYLDESEERGARLEELLTQARSQEATGQQEDKV